MKKFFVLAAAVVASVSGFAFETAQTKPAVDTEVHQRTLKGETLNVQAAAGKSGGVKADILACSLVDAGNIPADVVSAMIRGGFEASVVVKGAICKGANRDALVAVAMREGADPTSLVSPTAAGSAADGLVGGGFNGANFGTSPASTVGGGGRSSVSKS
ncbi:MAG TPA: hypothetical protein VIK56_09245 [Rhodoferax sp.]